MVNTLLRKTLFVALMVVGSCVRAEPGAWKIIPEQSSLSFTATQNGAPVGGAFKHFNGEIFVDPDNYKASRIHIVVDMKSVSTTYTELASTLMSAPWFDSVQFGTAEFTAESFKSLGENRWQAMGTVKIRNISAPVTLTFTTSQPDADTGRVEGDTTLQRTRFGVGQGEWASTKEVADNVHVHFIVVAKKTASQAASPSR
ncbi:putative YceI-like family protein [Legionella geestiana]|uniref:Putative YceI-like family protein n=1 Tax=Legionella geestiana TaxID=45065 RepID=A0A0W0U7L0_9GAMM|nr:YceI family protein [Legionella geestiana]KTD03770.1 putative YceI-like family protein [Legionella geestiana]QBS11944.1 YceI family protein [Legionella geestiana]QDQ40443.1 YceI family protein [Legionella geestiana]STX53343.1 putative YceI-like family protein [Legionella geestiana]